MSQDAEISIAPAAPIALSAAAMRMRDHRERRRRGLRCVMVQLRATEIHILVQKNLLNADARNDAYAVRDALHAYLDRTLSKAL